jgi:TolB-like protein/tRNA A-37 threonylcarbamoyl transferase component Bud32
MSDLRRRLQHDVAGRYEIERELGKGGMATVFLVRDLRHGRRVAMKLLREEIAAAVGATRFLREIEIAAQLQHLHIVPLYDSGEAGGTLFYVMPYAEEESLRDRLAREGQLPVEEVLRIGCEVASALAYAHGRQVIHRDIKPENILFSGGHAMVGDFGIARAVTQSNVSLTETGVVVGTALYMAPEQATAAASVDGRADVYALGCVLHECLTGYPPFAADSLQAVIARQLTTPAVSVRVKRPSVPEPMARAILRALERDPAKRHASAAEFLDALRAVDSPSAASAGVAGSRRRVMFGAAAVALLGVAAVLGLWRTDAAATAGVPATGVRSVAVLPLRNISADQSDQYFADGMTEELTGALAKVAGLSVAPRSSAFAFRNVALTSTEVGRRLDVDAIIDGSIQRSGDQLRLRAQLVSVRNDSVLWSESYSRSAADVIAVQEELARAIAEQLELTIAPLGTSALVRVPTQDLRAYDLYLQGRWHLARRSATELTAAVRLFEEAVRRDPAFALAYAGLADASGLLAAYGDVRPREGFERSFAAATRALALDSLSAAPHASVGFGALFFERDFARAERALDRALQIDSTYGFARVLRAWTYTMTGRPALAVADLEIGRRIEPLSLLVTTRLGSMLYYARRFPEAERVLREALALDPTYSLANAELAHQLAVRGRVDEAITAMAAAPDFRMRYEGGAIPFALGRAGRTAEARAALEERLRRRAGGYVDPGAIAPIYVGLGEIARAMEMLEHVVDERPWSATLLGIDPLWDPVRDDPRFRALLDRLLTSRP